MNSLSWLIYMAQILTSLGYLFITLGTLALLATIGGAVCMIVFTTFEHDKEAFAKTNRRGRVIVSIFAPMTVIFILVGNLLPDKDTLYAIAASQLGEQIVSSGDAKALANDAYTALRVWLKKQIADDKPSK